MLREPWHLDVSGVLTALLLINMITAETVQTPWSLARVCCAKVGF